MVNNINFNCIQPFQYFIMMIGVSGSGKSTRAEALKDLNGTDWYVLSSDKIREIDFKNINDQKHNKEVFETMQSKTMNLLKDGFSVIYDATNLTIKNRKNIMSQVCTYKKRNPHLITQAYVMRTPFLECLRNNSSRSRTVPLHVLNKQRSNFQMPLYGEGFDEIILSNYDEDKEYSSCTGYFVDRMKDFNQETHYHDFDLLTHQRKTLEYLCQNEILSTPLERACVLHDYGKLYTKTLNERGEYSYYGHANVGTYEILPYVEMLALCGKENIIRFLHLVNYHMLLFDLEKANYTTISKYRKLCGEELWSDLHKLHTADIYASKEYNETRKDENLCLQD